MAYQSQADVIYASAEKLGISPSTVTQALQKSTKVAKEEQFPFASNEYQRYQAEKLAWSEICESKLHTLMELQLTTIVGAYPFPGNFDVGSNLPSKSTLDAKSRKEGSKTHAASDNSQSGLVSAVESTGSRLILSRETNTNEHGRQSRSRIAGNLGSRRMSAKEWLEFSSSDDINAKLDYLDAIAKDYWVDIENLIEPIFFHPNEKGHPQYSVFANQVNAYDALAGPVCDNFWQFEQRFNVYIRQQRVYSTSGRIKGLFVWVEPSSRHMNVSKAERNKPELASKSHKYLVRALQILMDWVTSDLEHLPQIVAYTRDYLIDSPAPLVLEKLPDIWRSRDVVRSEP